MQCISPYDKRSTLPVDILYFYSFEYFSHFIFFYKHRRHYLHRRPVRPGITGTTATVLLRTAIGSLSFTSLFIAARFKRIMRGYQSLSVSCFIYSQRSLLARPAPPVGWLVIKIIENMYLFRDCANADC